MSKQALVSASTRPFALHRRSIDEAMAKKAVNPQKHHTGLETAIDRICPEWHDLSKRTKDMGSAAALLSLVLCAGIRAIALFQRLAA